jgi:hypothetical protein
MYTVVYIWTYVHSCTYITGKRRVTAKQEGEIKQYSGHQHTHIMHQNEACFFSFQLIYTDFSPGHGGRVLRRPNLRYQYFAGNRLSPFFLDCR